MPTIDFNKLVQGLNESANALPITFDFNEIAEQFNQFANAMMMITGTNNWQYINHQWQNYQISNSVPDREQLSALSYRIQKDCSIKIEPDYLHKMITVLFNKQSADYLLFLQNGEIHSILHNLLWSEEANKQEVMNSTRMVFYRKERYLMIMKNLGYCLFQFTDNGLQIIHYSQSV